MIPKKTELIKVPISFAPNVRPRFNASCSDMANVRGKLESGDGQEGPLVAIMIIVFKSHNAAPFDVIP